MKRSQRWSLCAIALLLPAAFVHAQTPDQPGFTLKASTNLVILDVVVTDAAGKPVHGLSAADFVLKEDGKPQTVKNFTEHSAPTAESLARAAPAPKLNPGLFTNFTPAVSEGPANVLLLDMLNTPLTDQNYAREQIDNFLSHAPANTRIAIFGLGNSLTILQGFTSDTQILKAALAGKSASQLSSLLNDANGGGGNDNGGATALSDSISTLGDTPDVQELVANAQQFEAETQALQFKVRAQITLDALNEIGRYLANIPGRKNLIWFSGSFPVSVLPNTDINNGFLASATSEVEFEETMTLLARGQVSLYPVDVRGLTTGGTFNTATSGQKYVRDPSAMTKEIAKFDAQLASENGTMLAAAKETGGIAFLNTNGLAAAVAQAVENGSNYYTLTYTPANRAEDGRYRKIELTSTKREAALSYRRGYYADEAAKPGQPAATAADTSVITRSMMRGAPPSTQIEFTARVRTATGVPETTAANGNEVMTSNPEAQPPYLRYAVDFAIDPRAFLFTHTGATFDDAIQFVAFVYDARGALVLRAGSTVKANFTDAVHANFVARPFSYNLDISAPQKGSYFLRLAIQDKNSQRIGAIEVPLDSVRKLPPLTPASAVSNP